MLKNLNVRYKILLVSVTMLIGMSSIGAKGIIKLGEARDAMEDMYSKNLVAVNVSGDMLTENRAISAILMEIYAQGGTDELYRDVEERLARMDANIETLSSLSIDKTQKELLAKIREENKLLKEFANTFVDQIKQDLLLEASLHFSENKGVVNTYQDQIRALNTYNIQLAEKAKNETDASYKAAINNYIVVWFIIFILDSALSFVITRNIKNGLKGCVEDIQVLATGDFTGEQDEKKAERKDEIGRLTLAVYTMQSSIKELISNAKAEVLSINNDVELVHEQCDRLDNEVQAVSATTQQLAAAMEETASLGCEMLAMSERMKEATGQITEKTQSGAERAKEIKERAVDANQMIHEGQEAAKKLYEDSKVQLESAIQEAKVVEEINVLSEGIMQITSQTNLLALNASIEAARAGEAGRGFAVVANEISFLADESKKTVSKIQDVTQKVMDAVDDLVNSSNALLAFVTEDVNESNERILKVIDAYKNDADFVSALVSEVSMETLEMNSTIERMGASIDAVSTAANESAEGITVAANSLSQISMSAREVLEAIDKTKESKDKLDQEVAKFSV